MDRRNTVLALCALGAAPMAVHSQPTGKVFRVGLLGTSAPELMRQGLREMGYVEGQNLILEWRDAAGKTERFDAIAAEFVRLNVDVVVASSPAATFAAKRATASIPIVMVNTPDPVQLGLVASLARPGGNITGTSTLSVDLSVKQLELLRAAVPRVVRIAVLWSPGNPWHALALKGLESPARSLASNSSSSASGPRPIVRRPAPALDSPLKSRGRAQRPWQSCRSAGGFNSPSSGWAFTVTSSRPLRC